MDFFIWSTNVKHNPNQICLGGSALAFQEIAKSLRELNDHHASRGDRARTFVCKNPEMGTPHLPFFNGKLEAKKFIRDRTSISFSEIESHYGIKFKWYESLKVELVDTKTDSFEVVDKKVIARVHPSRLPEMIKEIEGYSFPKGSRTHGYGWIAHGNDYIWLVADWLLSD